MIPPAASYKIAQGRTSKAWVNTLLAHAERERQARERREAGLPEAVPPAVPERGTVCCMAFCAKCGDVMLRRGTRGSWRHVKVLDGS